MLKIDRICVWIFIIFYATFYLGMTMVKFIDELAAFSILGIVLADCICNNSWRKYIPVWTLLSVTTIFLIYSLTAVHYNTLGAILSGYILELKPYITVISILCIAPRFTDADKKLLRIISWGIAALCVTTSVSIYNTQSFAMALFEHVSYWGGSCFMVAMVYLFASIREDGSLPRSALIFALFMLFLGLTCTRSKYYGEFTLVLFLLFVYRQGMLRNFSFTSASLLGIILVLIIAVAWKKIDYYYFSVSFQDIDLNNLPALARMALYLGMGLILFKYPIMGSGYASFASYSSISPYSSLYEEFGLSKIWGLSPDKPDFICDAYYASLAQYGLVGIALFIYLWVWLYKNLRAMTRNSDGKYHYLFIIGTSLLCFELIELTSGNMGVTTIGVLSLMLLGIICGYGKELRINKHNKIDTTPELPEQIEPARIK